MKIALNFTHYIKGRVGGHGNYMRSLAFYFPQFSPQDEFYIVCHPESRDELRQYQATIIEIPHVSTPHALSQLLTYTIRLYQIDIWYSPLLILDPLDCPCTAVFNIPDMQHEYYPNYFDSATLQWRRSMFQQSANHCHGLITVSNYSRQDLIRLLDIHPSKVFAIPVDAPHWFNLPIIESQKIIDKYSLKDHQYLFYPANFWPHKNHARLLEAFSQIKDKYPQINLVFTGYSYDSSAGIQSLVKKHQLQNRITYLGYIKDEEVPSIYHHALGMVFPSLFEGFATPLVEAMKTNCPIVCSRVTAIPEVAQDAALYFDPLSVTDIRQKLDLFLSDSKLRQKLVKAGQIRSQVFSYQNTAAQTLEVLKKIHRQNQDQTSKQLTPAQKYPKISVITPSFNQGLYIERTIKSILSQDYPNIEHIVVDGKSTDQTLKILHQYSDKIKWISEKDNGQTEAINKGLKMATGDILAYLNSDDTYEPGAFKKVAEFFQNHPGEVFVYGKGRHIDEKDHYIEDYPNAPTDYYGLHGPCPICQPATFWKREVIDQIGYFDDSLRYAMDYDYWIRIAKKYTLNYIDDYLGNTRLYPQTKTLGQRVPVHREIIKVQQKHYDKVNDHWIFALVHAQLASYDQNSLVGHTLFLSHLILNSGYYYSKYNHQLPPTNVLKSYYLWFKQILSFALKHKFTSIT